MIFSSILAFNVTFEKSFKNSSKVVDKYNVYNVYKTNCIFSLAELSNNKFWQKVKQVLLFVSLFLNVKSSVLLKTIDGNKNK